MKAIILAAGVGKRLWSLTQHRPKCLIELGGRTLLARYLDALAWVGIRQAVVVVGYKQDMIRSAVAADSRGVDVRYLSMSITSGAACRLSGWLGLSWTTTC